jgi:O-antigen/teichoic acid export membrane protein
LLGGLLVLVAPEFVRIALGDKWLPMVPAFRLMAIFTLLDPIRVTVSQVFVAIGQPERIIRVRLIQLLVLVAGMFALGLPFGISGVAIVMNLTLLVGLVPLLLAAREHVDLSFRRMFAAPVAAISAGLLAALSATYVACLSDNCPNDWMTGFVKAAAFLLTFGLVMWALEKQELMILIQRLAKILRGYPANNAKQPPTRL